MILTNEEIKTAVGFTTDQMVAYRKVEAAIIKKIGEPVAYEGKIYGTFSRSNYGDTENSTPLYKLPEAIK